MDVLIRSFSLGNRFHVLNLMAWLLARLIETLVWAHERTPLANFIVAGETSQLLFPIVQAV
jgi:hypothetical protein